MSTELPRSSRAGLLDRLSVVPVLRLAAHLPNPVVRALGGLGAALAVAAQPRGVRQWSANFQVVVGRRPTRAEQRAAIRSWARNLFGSLRLGRYTRAEILDLVVTDAAARDRYLALVASGPVVLALPHTGDWDLAGAWSGAVGAPIASVAERLPPDQFEYFMRVRAGVGMVIHAHDDPQAVPKLRADLESGRVVALVADRDLSGTGVPVDWQTASGPRTVNLPAGPAHLARLAGATLLPVASVFEGDRMRLVFGEPIAPLPGAVGVVAMTQQLADFFAAQVAEHPIDWHVLQPFFPGVGA